MLLLAFVPIWRILARYVGLQLKSISKSITDKNLIEVHQALADYYIKKYEKYNDLVGDEDLDKLGITDIFLLADTILHNLNIVKGASGLETKYLRSICDVMLRANYQETNKPELIEALHEYITTCKLYEEEFRSFYTYVLMLLLVSRKMGFCL